MYYEMWSIIRNVARAVVRHGLTYWGRLADAANIVSVSMDANWFTVGSLVVSGTSLNWNAQPVAKNRWLFFFIDMTDLKYLVFIYFPEIWKSWKD